MNGEENSEDENLYWRPVLQFSRMKLQAALKKRGGLSKKKEREREKKNMEKDAWWTVLAKTAGKYREESMQTEDKFRCQQSVDRIL